MHIHILGIGGTFMSGLALLARAAGFEVTGSDLQCYPPVSDLLAQEGIGFEVGYDDATTALAADLVVIGNVMKRGMPVIETILAARKPYISGPQWLAEHILPRYRVIAISGTHGKTTTTTMTAHILFTAGLNPGFLIGGVAPGFNTSARAGDGPFFVIEADEYDTAFFDKRPKLMHYHPEIAVWNNLEFDHADIYPDLAAIEQQFHYFHRTIPSNGLIIKPSNDPVIDAVLARGEGYCRVESRGIEGVGDWVACLLDPAGRAFEVLYQGDLVATVEWSVIGRFNVENALSAIAASMHAGVSPEDAARALRSFTPPKRRLEMKFQRNGVTVFDDFAHHPTAIMKTLEALRQTNQYQRLVVLLELGSNSMRAGAHAAGLPDALALADEVYLLDTGDDGLCAEVAHCYRFRSVPEMVTQVTKVLRPNDAVIIMSNRGFGNIQQLLVNTMR